MSTTCGIRPHFGATALLLRWVLIVATSYLIVFNHAPGTVPLHVSVFVAAYLTSNLLLAHLPAGVRARCLADGTLVLLDTLAVATGLLLTASTRADFFPVYFLVVFLAALSRRIGLVVIAALLVGAVHLAAISHYVDANTLIRDGYALRLPFLLAVALFFGHAVGIAQRRRRAERARARKRRALDSLSAVVHDVKNPLATIQSLAELLLEGDAGPLTPEQADLTRRIHASTRHVIRLAVNLLDASRIDADHLVTQPIPASVADVVAHAVDLARSSSILKGVTLDLRSTSPPPRTRFDPLQIERVVSNLLDNAIKYTAPGGTVTVTTSSGDDHVAFTVRDTGPGIPPDEVAHLFAKYHRRTATSGVDGTGLGLFIVESIVRAHGGTVSVASTPGCGTAVTVRLPSAPVVQAPVPARPVLASPRLTWG